LTGVGTSLLIRAATEQLSALQYKEQGLHYIDVTGKNCVVPCGAYSVLYLAIIILLLLLLLCK